MRTGRPLAARLAASEKSGNVYLVGMLGSAASAAALYASMKSAEQQRCDLRHELENNAWAAARADTRERLNRLGDLSEAPVLAQGVLTKASRHMVGHMFLRGARVGQEVDVLEEGVGPRAGYLTVIDRSRGELGMYPARWVAPIATG